MQGKPDESGSPIRRRWHGRGFDRVTCQVRRLLSKSARYARKNDEPPRAAYGGCDRILIMPARGVTPCRVVRDWIGSVKPDPLSRATSERVREPSSCPGDGSLPLPARG